MNNTSIFDTAGRYTIQDKKVRDGLLFIPDISGFTEFVHSTDVLTGKQITYELLSAIISQNDLKLNIAEVEGDAVLFYRYGARPSLHQLVEQYEMMTKAFDRKRKQLEKTFSKPLDLSLKIVAHYGAMTEFEIGPFKKLYGEVVVEAHRLLKNSISSDRYLLLTDSLLQSLSIPDYNQLKQHGIRANKVCEVYGGLRNICFTYLDFSHERKWKQVA